MSFKNYYYTDIDGDHFPDAHLGSDLYYGLDFSCWLDNELDSLVSVDWILPDGITSEDDFIQGTVGNIKLKANRTGIFRLVCTLTSAETLNQVTLTQEKSITTMLRVY